MSIFPTRILLATDGSEEAALAARSATGIAAKTGSELHVVTVGPEYPYYELPDYTARFEEVFQAQKREAQEVLDEQVREIEESGGTVEEAHLTMSGRPDRAIVDQGERLSVGLIVVGSRGRGGIRRALMGSVSDSVVRHAHCPVLVVRGEPVTFPTKMLLATDGSRDAELATTTAAVLADSIGSELHVVTVFPGSAYVHPYYEVHFPEAAEQLRRVAREERQEMLDEQVERIREAGRDVAQTYIRTGETAQEIVALADELGAGVVVMGSHGFGGIRRALIGSVAASVVPHAHCPVLVVRREEV
jgi:nucleotide-binding universal stress UspA family protein